MTSPTRRADAFRSVIPFVLRGWGRRRRLAAAVAAAITASTLADVALPFYAGRLVDALTSRPRRGARLGPAGLRGHDRV